MDRNPGKTCGDCTGMKGRVLVSASCGSIGTCADAREALVLGDFPAAVVTVFDYYDASRCKHFQPTDESAEIGVDWAQREVENVRSARGFI